MAGKNFRTKKKPRLSPAQQFAVLREEVRKPLVVVADQHVKRREAVKSNQHGRFKFKGVAEAEGTVISTRVTLENGDESLGRYGKTVRELWEWLNRGTGIHGPYKKFYAIYPRFKQALRFVVGGTVFIRKYVFDPKKRTHPGMKPRHYTVKINQSLQGFERKQTEKGFANAWKRLERMNRQ